MKITTLPLANSQNRLHIRCAFLLMPLVLACFALSPRAQAVCQHGCDTRNGNTFLGEDANTGGVQNTAIGERALSSNTAGLDTTATGLDPLANTTSTLRASRNSASWPSRWKR